MLVVRFMLGGKRLQTVFVLKIKRCKAIGSLILSNFSAGKIFLNSIFRKPSAYHRTSDSHKHFLRLHSYIAIGMGFLLFIPGCFGTRGFTEIKAKPYDLIYQDDSTSKFGDHNDDVFIEVRTAKISRPLENLAIHYTALFPGGEIIRPGDSEEYLRIDGHNAYKVVFRTKYIRKRKRVENKGGVDQDKVPEGWTAMTMEDPLTGKPIPVLHGPVIPQQRIMYLVQGDSYIYYIFLRADGDAVDQAIKKLDTFVREGIEYK